ncbi:MAG TPA: hypothetical protein VK213_05070 [Bacteroidales bacterium]|nr:hypothetical protein [Bacteroidales bacterium]
MAIRSKIKFFLITILLASVSFSCNKKNDIIPDVVVDFYIDINDARFSTQLNSIGGSVAIDAGSLNEPYAAGFNASGIIITRGVDEYYAYDRTCPHEYSLDKSVVRINIDQTGFAKAICPVCKTPFELLSFGTPTPGGVSRYPLKNYRTSFDGRFIRVWNN